MATIIRYVNTASSGGDGTTNNTSGGTAAYASLSAAEAALRQNLTGVTCDVADEQGNNTIALDILCTGTSADTTAVSFGGTWVTDSTHRLRIRLNGTGAGPKWDSSLYRLVAGPAAYTGVIHVNMAIHLTLQDLQVESTSAMNAGGIALRFNNFAWNVHVVRGFYRQTSTTGAPDEAGAMSISMSSAAGQLYMQNVASVGAGASAFWRRDYFNATTAKMIFYNCTFVRRSGTTDPVFWFSGDGTNEFRLKNLLIQGTGTNYSIGDSADEEVTILTQDTSSPTTSLRSKTVSFVDATNWDYHLSSGDTSAKDAGTDLSADSYYPFSTDGDGATRSGTWDVGADELTAGPTTMYLLNSTASGSNHGSLQFGGSAPSTATIGTGWTVDTVASGNHARMAYATERASSNFSGTAQPSGAPDNTLGDCWRSSSTLTGDFATGAWTIAVPVIAVTAAAGQDGRVRVRLWKSANADGSSATEITAGATAGTTVTDLTTGAEQVSTVTTASITGFSLANEYLFVQVAWEITGAAA